MDRGHVRCRTLSHTDVFSESRSADDVLWIFKIKKKVVSSFHKEIMV